MKEQCFGGHGLYDVDDDIANSTRSSLDPGVDFLSSASEDIL